MTQEDKDLLFKDLCARLPYKVICNALVRSNNTDTPPISSDYCLTHNLLNYVWIDCYKLRPYLRPMSSMTEEEKKEFQACHCVYGLHPDFQPIMCNLANELNMFDWLNAHHFDYRGLIRKGLAIEAPERMYKID